MWSDPHTQVFLVKEPRSSLASQTQPTPAQIAFSTWYWKPSALEYGAASYTLSSPHRSRVCCHWRRSILRVQVVGRKYSRLIQYRRQCQSPRNSSRGSKISWRSLFPDSPSCLCASRTSFQIHGVSMQWMWLLTWQKLHKKKTKKHSRAF